MSSADRATTPHGRRTYEALLEAGRTLAIAEGPALLSISRIAEAAGVAKGTFYVHFHDREDFLAALRTGFDERMGEVISAAVADMPAGIERLVAGLTAYLDACLADRPMKALVRELGATATDGSERGDGFARMIARNLKASGWSDVRSAALLVTALVGRIALLELESGRRQSGARRVLWRMLGVSDRRSPEPRKRSRRE